jgi:Flp pilus assembly protein TadD
LNFNTAKFWKAAVLGITLTLGLARSTYARDLKITLPKGSLTSPVQQLNREGVQAVQKNQYDKAKALFYKAYLLDPGDPFTLNNLGYIAELEGQQDRAQAFYSQAGSQTTNALVDRTNVASLRGQSLKSAVGTVHDAALQINRANVEAVRLLSQDRAFEAEQLLQRTLTLDRNNGFTLNNLGVAKEVQGDYGDALKYYAAAAGSHTSDTVVVSPNPAWRGKPVTEMAAESAKRLHARMDQLQSAEAQTALFNLRGVAAMNRNDWRRAQENFAHAYKLSPQDAFSLNNQAVVSEMNGDLETAQDFYREAQSAPGSNGKIGFATRPRLEGARLDSVANVSEISVDGALQVAGAARRQAGTSVLLKHRDGTPVIEPSTKLDTLPTAPSHP